MMSQKPECEVKQIYLTVIFYVLIKSHLLFWRKEHMTLLTSIIMIMALQSLLKMRNHVNMCKWFQITIMTKRLHFVKFFSNSGEKLKDLRRYILMFKNMVIWYYLALSYNSKHNLNTLWIMTGVYKAPSRLSFSYF
jgi:hypothetical protein